MVKPLFAWNEPYPNYPKTRAQAKKKLVQLANMLVKATEKANQAESNQKIHEWNIRIRDIREYYEHLENKLADPDTVWG